MAREQLNIDTMERLKAKPLESGVMETGDQVIVCRAGTGRDVSARHVSVSLSVVQQITVH